MNQADLNKHKQNFSWRINWKITVFSLLFLPIFCTLGVWQLNRGAEKQTLQENWVQQQSLPPITQLPNSTDDSTQYRRFQGLGRFDSTRYWLVENKVFKGRNGYHVISPFTLSKGGTLLVNRGWVAGTGQRDQLPQVEITLKEQLVVGNLIAPSHNRFLSMLAQSDDSPWPRVILESDIDQMTQEYGAELFNKILQIEASVDSAFQVAWQPFNMSPSKHHGYAVQWFGMAIALLVLSIFANSNLADILRRKA